MTEHQTTESQTAQSEATQTQTAQTPPPPYQAPYQAPAQPPFKRLTRTSWDGPVSGVCGGVARYLGVDPTLVRVLAAVTMVVTFPVGVIAYAVMWAVIPKE
jgi:phage shock protein PspC (stress-responsive transcriptional regulator)